MTHPNMHPLRVRPAIKVVIVDDDLLVRSMLAELLNAHPDLEVTHTFGCGAEALAGVIGDPPDVMLLDISMPRINGCELTRLVRESVPEVGVLALTELIDDKTVADTLRAGALGFLSRDTPCDAIALAIRAAHCGLSVLTPSASSGLVMLLGDEEPPRLTETEAAILKLVGTGHTNARIASQVHLSPSTVKYHVSVLSGKLGATNRVTLAVRAGRLRLL